MLRNLLIVSLLVVAVAVCAAQERVTPASSKGGVKYGEPWKDIPESFRKPENFRSVMYLNTGHEYLPEMRDEMVMWFEKHLAK